MTDNERIAEFLGWAECPGHGQWFPPVETQCQPLRFDTSREGWANLGELVAAIEAKGWTWSSDYARYELLASYWADVRIGESTYRGEADNLPEAVKNAVLAARGLHVIPVDANWRQLVIPHRCPRLTETNRCEIHESKPGLCREFPAEPMQIEGIEGCTYWFTRGEANDD